MSCDTFAMEFSIKTLSPETAKAGCVVLGIYANQELTPAARRADQAAKGALRKALSDLSGKAGSTLTLRSLPGIAAERVLLVGLGERTEFGESAYRDAVRGAANALKAGREGCRLLPRRHEGRRAAPHLERAPCGTRLARSFLPLRPAEVAEEAAGSGPAARGRSLHREKGPGAGASKRQRRSPPASSSPRPRQPAAEHLHPGLPRGRRRRSSPRSSSPSAKCSTAPRCRSSAWARCWPSRRARTTRRS